MAQRSLILAGQMQALIANGAASAATPGGIDHAPVVKLFTPDAAATWLLSEIDPHNPDIAFGLCDLGLGEPELGSVSISEIAAVRGRFRLPPERDEHFQPKGKLTEYAKAARAAGRIVNL